MISVVLAVLSVPWFKTSFAWALSNVLYAQEVIDPTGDGLVDLGIKIGGVTVPFAVGWFWNRNYLKAKDKYNDYLQNRLADEIWGRDHEREQKEQAWAAYDMLRERAQAELGELRIQIAEAKAAAK